jgi:hypothetical protein
VGISTGTCEGCGVGAGDGSDDNVGCPVGLRIEQTSQVSSQMPALGQVRQKDLVQ